MAQFDGYANPDANERKVVPYLLDVRHGYLQGREQGVVIPTSALRRPVADLLRDQLTIQDALDTLFGSH